MNTNQETIQLTVTTGTALSLLTSIVVRARESQLDLLKCDFGRKTLADRFRVIRNFRNAILAQAEFEISLSRAGVRKETIDDAFLK